MDLLPTGKTLHPGLPARTGDAASDGEKADESATFEVFLDLALALPSPDAAIASGPEGNASVDDTLTDIPSPGNPATASGNSLPAVLPAGLTALPQMPGDALPEVTAPSLVPQVQSVRLAAATGPANISAAPEAAPSPEVQSAQGSARALALALTMQPDGEVTIPRTAQPRAETAPTLSAVAVLQLLASPARDNVAKRGTPAPVAPVSTDGQAEAAAPVASSASALPFEVPVLAANTRIVAPPISNDPALPVKADVLPVAQPDAPPVSEATSQVRKDSLAADAAKPAEAPSRAVALDIPTFVSSASVPSTESQPFVIEAKPVTQATPTLSRGPESQAEAHDFTGIVDRLARAREGADTDMVRTSLATREFGMVAMQMRSGEGRLHVALTSTDPAFAPAVQAASAAGSAGQQSTPDGSQSQQQGQPAFAQSQGQAQQDGQTRQQQAERFASAQRAQAAGSAPTDSKASPDHPGSEASGSIYA